MEIPWIFKKQRVVHRVALDITVARQDSYTRSKTWHRVAAHANLMVMTEPTYEIVFRGKLVRDADPAVVHSKLMVLFRADAGRIDALLAAPKATLKRGLTKEHASTMQEALREAGLIVAMVNETPLTAAAVPSAAIGQMAAPVVATPQPIASQMAQPMAERDAAPAAAVVLEAQIPIVDNLADAVMMPVGAILAEPVKHIAPVIVDSHLTLAEVGITISEYVAVAKPEIPDSLLTMAERGEILDQEPRVEVVELPDMDMTLAEPGEVIIVAPVKAEPRYFDLSGMTLEPMEESEDETPSALLLALGDQSDAP